MWGSQICSTTTVTMLLAGVLSSCSAPGLPAAQPGLGTVTPAAGQTRPSICLPAPALSLTPRRIVTMDGGAAAILTELGVGDRIVGTASPDFFTAFTEPQRGQLNRIPVLDAGRGAAETVINAKPDLVVGVSAYSFGGFDGTPTADQLHRAGAQLLVACPRTSAAGSVEDLSETTTFITQAARVLQIQERGAALNSRISAEIARARTGLPPQPLRVLVLSTPPVAGQPMVTQGGRSLANGVITLAGGRNIAGNIDTDFTSLSAEAVLDRDPQAIVVMTGFAARHDQELIGAIRANPLLAGTTAVRQGRLVAIPQSILLSPSVLNGAAVTAIAQALRAPAL